MLNKLLIILLCIITFLSCTYAQDVKVDSVPETKLEKKEAYKKYSISQFGHESFLFIKEPTMWKGRDWIIFGIAIGATFCAMPLDKTMYESTQGTQRFYYNPFVVGGRVYGEWYSIGGVAAIAGVYGVIKKANGAKKITIELLQAGIYSEAITLVFKIVVGRARPYQSENSYDFKPFTLFNDAFHSMPSGHSTNAMALSTVISRHSKLVVFKILAYVPAGLTLFARIYQNKHWLSDEIPGAAIGYFVGNWVVDLHSGRRQRINVTSIYPAAISICFNKQPNSKLNLLN